METMKSIAPVEIQGVHGYVDDKGTVWLKLEDVVHGLGFVQKQIKNGKEYTFVRWNRINNYLNEFGFPPIVVEESADAFVPEHIFYRLAMKANNAIANAFQEKIANEILPAIRKYGAYMTPDTIKKILLTPDFIINLATKLKEEQEKNAVLTQTVQTLEPKANYCDIILNCPDTVTTTIIAKDYGMSARAFNEMLSGFKIQFKQSGVWMLYARYADKGYTQSKTHHTVGANGKTTARVSTAWTQTGRMFLYKMLRKHDVFPAIEKLNFKGE